MTLARLITTRVMLPIFVGSREFMAGSGAAVVNFATHLTANLAREGNTAQILFLVRAFHAHFVRAGLLGELNGHGIRQISSTGFSPVKLYPKKGAAGAARTARMSHL